MTNLDIPNGTKYPLLRGTEDTIVTVRNLVRYTIGRTLADLPMPHSDSQPVIDVVIARICDHHDLEVQEVAILAVDVSRIPSMYGWQVDLAWQVLCHLCSNPAVKDTGTTGYTEPLCFPHLEQAYQEDGSEL